MILTKGPDGVDYDHGHLDHITTAALHLSEKQKLQNYQQVRLETRLQRYILQ